MKPILLAISLAISCACLAQEQRDTTIQLDGLTTTIQQEPQKRKRNNPWILFNMVMPGLIVIMATSAKKRREQKMGSISAECIDAIANQNQEEVPTLEQMAEGNNFLMQALGEVKAKIADSAFETAQLSKALSVSPSTLYRKIKSATNLSPSEFIRDARLEHAHNLISKNAKSTRISEIAYAVGFGSPKHFSACFKTKYEYTPSQLKAKLTQKN